MANQKNKAEDFAKRMRPLREHSEASVRSRNTVDFDGIRGSVQSGSVQDSRLNSGKPTLIPFIWDGRKVDAKEAIKRAIESGVKWPVFDTNEQATEASMQLSNSLGERNVANRITESAGRVFPALLNTVTLGKFGAGQKPRPIFSLRTGRTEIDPEIQKLTRTVMQAAAGKPLKVSITEQRRQQEIVEGFLRQFRERQLSDPQEGQSSVQAASREQVSSPAPSSSSDSSSKSDSNPVTTDDLAGIQKSIEKLSSGLAQESK